MKNQWILPAATLVVGAVGGFISGQNTADSGDEAAANERAASRSSSAGSRLGETAIEKNSKGRSYGSLAEISKIPGSTSRVQALINFYSGLSPEELAEEARKLDSLPMGERIMASMLLFGQWGEKDPLAAMEFASTMGFEGRFVKPTVLKSWASVDPVNAAKYYEANPREFDLMGRGRGGGGSSGASTIASEWAKLDPDAALAWASGLESGGESAISSVVGEVAKTDPAKAAEMLAASDSDDKGRAYQAIAEQYGAQDFDEAKAWIASLPADEQDAALAAAIEGLSSEDPAAAAKEVASMADGDAKDSAIRSIVDDLAAVDAAWAAEFLKEEASSDAQERGMRDLMPSYVSSDPEAALEYANSFENEEVRNTALSSYVFSNTTSDPADLISVAETITDERDQGRAVGMTAVRWYAEDPAAATEYINSTEVISDNMKERILSGTGMSRGGRGGGGGGR